MATSELIVVSIARICLAAVFLPSAYGKPTNQQCFEQGATISILPVALLTALLILFCLVLLPRGRMVDRSGCTLRRALSGALS